VQEVLFLSDCADADIKPCHADRESDTNPRPDADPNTDDDRPTHDVRGWTVPSRD
jgi:hypothetical protein